VLLAIILWQRVSGSLGLVDVQVWSAAVTLLVPPVWRILHILPTLLQVVALLRPELDAS